MNDAEMKIKLPTWLRDRLFDDAARRCMGASLIVRQLLIDAYGEKPVVVEEKEPPASTQAKIAEKPPAPAMRANAKYKEQTEKWLTMTENKHQFIYDHPPKNYDWCRPLSVDAKRQQLNDHMFTLTSRVIKWLMESGAQFTSDPIKPVHQWIEEHWDQLKDPVSDPSDAIIACIEQLYKRYYPE